MERSVLLTGLLFFTIGIYIPSSAFAIEPVTKETLEQQKLNYELQERCRETAKRVYEDEWNLPLGSRNYQNHYNGHLNKCFILVTDKAAQYLIDVNEHKYYMFIYSDGRCIIEHTFPCKNVQDWDAFVKKMMEE